MGNTQGSHVEKMGGVPGIGPVTAGVTDGGSMSPTHRQDGNVFDFSASTKKKTVVGQDSIEDDRLVMHAAGAGTAPTSAAGSPIPGGAYGVVFFQFSSKMVTKQWWKSSFVRQFVRSIRFVYVS